jgi:hypothetical protein
MERQISQAGHGFSRAAMLRKMIWALDSLLEIKRKRAKAYLSKRVLVEFIWQGLGSRFE